MFQPQSNWVMNTGCLDLDLHGLKKIISSSGVASDHNTPYLDKEIKHLFPKTGKIIPMPYNGEGQCGQAKCFSFSLFSSLVMS